ncbi:MAG TPA: sarcosine oxidase subunit gamma family protein [Azospirillum sp.]|nr:sarcosine oxidase subunit gamma family protein [Azospirillum sp.]
MFDALLKPGRHGETNGPAGVFAAPAGRYALATVVAGRNRAEELAAALEARFGVRPPMRPGYAAGDRVGFVGVGPGRWLAMDANGDGSAFEGALRDAVADRGAVTDQTDAFGLLHLSGPAVRKALAKGVTVDLHPAAFRPGDAATTVVGHIGVTVWQVDEAPAYQISVARSYAESFLDWLLASAAEYGVEVTPAGRG